MVSFFDLPLSIREQIYRQALVMARIFVRPFVSMDYLLDPDRAQNYGTPTLSLLRTSRQIHEEATPIYLSENTFSIVQVDLLAAACRESPRVAHNLRQIRHVELLFDSRDYTYMAQFLVDQLPAVSAAISDLVDESVSKHHALRALHEMHARFLPAQDSLQRSRSTSTVSAAMSSPESHLRHIENMREFLWGRTLTFVRQTFRLACLHVDLRRCVCVDGCCRLAGEVLGWGEVRVWVHGLPGQILVRGTSGMEKEVIARVFDTQRFRWGLRVEDVCGLDGVEGARGFGYDAFLRSAWKSLVWECPEA